MSGTVRIQQADGSDLSALLPGLTDILHAVVQDGGSVGFVLPFDRSGAEQFWQQQFADVRAGLSDLFLARVDGALAGTVQLRPGVLPNQTHRADVSKLLVHPAFRRLGIAGQLMDALEQKARARHLHLLTLDTRTGDVAEPLYRARGYQTAGIIPEYARAPDGSDRFDATTYMYKLL